LYHWRLHEKSVSQNFKSKPWAIAAQSTVRRKFASESKGELTFDSNLNALTFKEGVSPTIKKISISTDTSTSKIDSDLLYNGKESARDFLIRLRSHIQDNSPDTIMHFTQVSAPQLAAPPNTLYAYALLPNIGAVWPFKNRSQKLGYTLIPGTNILKGTPLHLGSFTGFSANVLTGPFHHLVATFSSLSRSIEKLLESECSILNDPIPLDQIGALIGLQNIQIGLRNVSIATSLCDYTLEQFQTNWNFLPSFDPYAH
jgi:hypothetical protein